MIGLRLAAYAIVIVNFEAFVREKRLNYFCFWSPLKNEVKPQNVVQFQGSVKNF